MAQKTKIMPFRTLKFNEYISKPYNIGFNEDEMNIHFP